MSSGYKTQITRQIGEHLVVAELGKRGIIATPFAGNVPDYDILASDTFGHSLPIQVKTINGQSWQFNIELFLDIDFRKNGLQIVKGKKRLNNPNLICVFVLLNNDNDEYFIFRLKNLQDYFACNYKTRKRPKNPKSTHCAISPNDLVKFKNKWELITNEVKAIE